MSTVSQVYDYINQIAPFSLTMDFDNTGILVGDRTQKVSKALIALDCTMQVVEQAKKLGAELIITHHPIIFNPIKRVNEDSVVYHLIRSDIAVISVHTNLDIAQGGVNDALASTIGLCNCRGLEMVAPQSEVYLGRIGELPEAMSALQFAQHIKTNLNAVNVKFADAKRTIKKVALCSGSGGDCLDAAIEMGADALLTSEVKQHQFLAAIQANVSIFDAGHFDTEDIVIEPLKEKLSQQISDVEFFTTHVSTITAI